MKKEYMNELISYSENILEITRKIDNVYNNALNEHSKQSSEWKESTEAHKDNIVLEHIRDAMSELVYARANILTAQFLNDENNE